MAILGRSDNSVAHSTDNPGSDAHQLKGMFGKYR